MVTLQNVESTRKATMAHAKMRAHTRPGMYMPNQGDTSQILIMNAPDHQPRFNEVKRHAKLLHTPIGWHGVAHN
eukprot:scaffold216219_cov16-Tisochrysis_lutea.AAC.1